MSKKQRPTQLHEAFRPCRDFIIAMIPLLGMSAYLYGPRPLVLAAIAVFTAFLCELFVSALRGTRLVLGDISGYMFALMFTLMLPATAGYDIVAVGSAVTVLLGKHAFGGYGCYPFNPAAFGFAFTSVCWSDRMYMYPKAFSNIGLGFVSGAPLQNGIASTLKAGGVPSIAPVDLLLGNYPGPMGTTFCLIILSCIVLLIAHGAMTWHIPVTFLLTCAAWAFAFPRVPTGRLDSLTYEMLSGAIVFAAAFIVAEPTTSPHNSRAKIVYGIILGIGTMIFRAVGVFEMGVCFAVLLLNPLSSYLDRRFSKRARKIKRTAKR